MPLQNPEKGFLRRWKSRGVSTSITSPYLGALEAPPARAAPFQKPEGQPWPSPWMHSRRHPYPYESSIRRGMTLNRLWVAPLCPCPARGPRDALRLWINLAAMDKPKERKSDPSPLHPTTGHPCWTACIVVDPSQHENLGNGGHP